MCWHIDIGEPPALVDAMVANHAAYKNVESFAHGQHYGSRADTASPEYAENFHPNVWFLQADSTRKCVEAGYGDFTPYVLP